VTKISTLLNDYWVLIFFFVSYNKISIKNAISVAKEKEIEYEIISLKKAIFVAGGRAVVSAIPHGYSEYLIRTIPRRGR
jgi:hypothetical protein